MGSSFKAISADATTKHGFSTHFCVVDELHAQRDRELVDVLLTSTGARRQPMVVYLTTSDFERESICNEKVGYAHKVRDGIIDDPRPIRKLRRAQSKAAVLTLVSSKQFQGLVEVEILDK